ncbi:hypothetical protein [Acetobacter malorum]|uniref:hypothetical protein n=1 Tax=Acetobacter malorum TaxID=178901 RepID=UPI0039ECA7C0
MDIQKGIACWQDNTVNGGDNSVWHQAIANLLQTATGSSKDNLGRNSLSSL